MKLNTGAIPGFDALPEDTKKYLSNLEVAENGAYNNLATENARLTKELRAKQTEEERLASEQAAAAAAAKAEKDQLASQLAELQKTQNITTQQTRLLALGYSEELAKQAAEHLVNGDFEKFNAVQAKFLETRDAKQKEQRLDATPYAPKGAPGGAVDLTKQIEDARTVGDWAAVAQLTRVQQQQQAPTGT